MKKNILIFFISFKFRNSKFTWTLNIDVTKNLTKKKIANQAEIANVDKTILLKPYDPMEVKQGIYNDGESMNPRTLKTFLVKYFSNTAYLIKQNHQGNFHVQFAEIK